LVVGSYGGRILLDLGTRRQIAELPDVDDAQFSRDATKLATSHDNMVKLWDTATGKQIGAPLQHVHKVDAIQFSPDGRRLATASRGVWLWELTTAKPLCEPRGNDEATDVAFDSRGTKLAIASNLGNPRLWKVPAEVIEPADHVMLWAETLANARLADDLALQPIHPKEFEMKRNLMWQNGGPPRAYLDAIARDPGASHKVTGRQRPATDAH
jgi:WD40 repeat protein